MTDVFNASETDKVETPEDTTDKRLKDKDDFIEQLKSEQAQLRAELAKKVDAEKALEELRNELKSLKEQKSASPQAKENTTPALSEVDIRTLVQKTITEAESVRSTEQNIKTANDTLVATLGGDVKKAVEHVQKRAKELGVSVQFLKDVAAKSPTAFNEVMGIKTDKVEDNSTFVQGSVNSEGLTQNKVIAKEGTKAFFDNIRKTDPKRYWTPEVQNQLWKAAKNGTYQ